MLSLRSIALLTAALSITTHAAKTITVINECSYALTLEVDHGSETDLTTTTSTLSAGATSRTIDYDEELTTVSVYSGDDDLLNALMFKAQGESGNAYYGVSQLSDSSTVGHDFTVKTDNADCPTIDGASWNLSADGDGKVDACGAQPAFTWLLCG